MTPLFLAPWVNVGGIGDGVVADVLAQFARVFQSGAEDAFDAFDDWFLTIDVASMDTDGPALWGEPDNCDPGTCEMLQSIHDSVFFGEITGLAIVLLLASIYTQSAASIFGLGSRREYLRRNRKALPAFMLIVMWYPIAVGFLGIVNALTAQLVPGGFGTQMASLASDITVEQTTSDSTVINPLAFVLVTLSGFLAAVFRLAFQIRLVAVLALLYAGPIVIVARYSGIEALENAGRRILSGFVGLGMLPLAVGLLAGLFGAVGLAGGSTAGDVFADSATAAGVVVLAFEVTALYLAWQLVSTSGPAARIVAAVTPVVEAVERPGGPGQASGRGGERTGGTRTTEASTGQGPTLRRTANDPGENR